MSNASRTTAVLAGPDSINMIESVRRPLSLEINQLCYCGDEADLAIIRDLLRIPGDKCTLVAGKPHDFLPLEWWSWILTADSGSPADRTICCDAESPPDVKAIGDQPLAEGDLFEELGRRLDAGRVPQPQVQIAQSWTQLSRSWTALRNRIMHQFGSEGWSSGTGILQSRLGGDASLHIDTVRSRSNSISKLGPVRVTVPALSWISRLDKVLDPGNPEEWVERLVTWSAVMAARGQELRANGDFGGSFWALWRCYDLFVHAQGVEAQVLTIDLSGRFIWSSNQGTGEVTSKLLHEQLGITGRDQRTFRQIRNDMILGHGLRGVNDTCVEMALRICRDATRGGPHERRWIQQVREIMWRPVFTDFLLAARHWGMKQLS